MTDSKYSVPEGGVGLDGPVRKAEPGTLPVRADLAHVALADRYLAAHYAVPIPRTAGPGGATLRLAPAREAEEVETLVAGTPIEALDYAGEWCWGCLGPDGPTGHVLLTELVDEG